MINEDLKLTLRKRVLIFNKHVAFNKEIERFHSRKENRISYLYQQVRNILELRTLSTKQGTEAAIQRCS